MIRKLTPKDYKKSEWSGGMTTQLAIFPPEAKYADRDFLWRVSSASVELEDSDFTPLPDYERLIAALEGEIVLTHDSGAPLRLRPFEVHAFSGASATHSTGRCTDFNLMLRRGKAVGSMEALSLADTPTVLHTAEGETLLLYCAKGSCGVEPSGCALLRGEALLAVGPDTLTLTGPARLMLCRMHANESE